VSQLPPHTVVRPVPHARQQIAFVSGGAFLGALDLSNGLRVRLGNLIAGCP
jgi:hypothetical protein